MWDLQHKTQEEEAQLQISKHGTTLMFIYYLFLNFVNSSVGMGQWISISSSEVDILKYKIY